MVKQKTYPNGLRIIADEIPDSFSVTVGVLVGAGSRNETAENNGISHFIEHMLFKGTAKRNAFEISDAIDSIGGQINAFTTKETTCYYVKTIAEHTEEAVEVLSDLFFNSVFDEKEAEREKGVVKEEINMTEDTPDELCFDLLAEARFGKGGLGATILGPAENVDRFTKADILSYMARYYVPANVVVSFAGRITFEEAVAIADKYFAGNFKHSGPVIKDDDRTGSYFNEVRKRKDIEQSHLCFCYPACSYASDKNDMYMLMNTVLGGGMSGVLFQKVREELGLAYSVYSYVSTYRDRGSLCIYAGVNPKNLALARDCILDETQKLMKRGLTEKEFLRAKEQIKGSFIFGQESNSSRMLLYAKYLLYTDKMFDFEKKLADINAVTLEGLNEFIKTEVDVSKYACACVEARNTK